jgi:DNA-binding PadR family transcriptional regulator
MTNRYDSNKYLPLTEATYYILLAVDEPLHGYGVMQKVETISTGTVRLGPGTLYGAFQSLEKEGLICMVREEERRKCYQLTEKGRQVLAAQVERLQLMVKNGVQIVHPPKSRLPVES